MQRYIHRIPADPMASTQEVDGMVRPLVSWRMLLVVLAIVELPQFVALPVVRSVSVLLRSWARAKLVAVLSQN